MATALCVWCFKELDGRPKFCSLKCGQAYHYQLERFGVADHSRLPICPCGNLACPDPWKTNGRRQMGKHRRCLDCRKAQRARADAGRGSYKAKRRREIVKAGEKISFDDLLMRDGPLCQICGELMDWQTGRHRERVSLDHIIPISKGGLHTMDNVRLVHLSCNSRKSDKVSAHVLCLDQ
ncbi:MAG: HNH endonuclease [Caulobacteraceae bacterium]|nr:HNH endonuclease [Caulobacteraceae bacterium]